MKQKLKIFLFYSFIFEIICLFLFSIFINIYLKNLQPGHSICDEKIRYAIPYLNKYYDKICYNEYIVDSLNLYYSLSISIILITFLMQLKFVIGVNNIFRDKNYYVVIGFWIFFIFSLYAWLNGINMTGARYGDVYKGNIFSLIAFSITFPICQLVVNLLTWKRNIED